MTIKKLKELIADLPDSARIYADDSSCMLTDEWDPDLEFVSCIRPDNGSMTVVLQKKSDIDVHTEIAGLAEIAIDEGWSDDVFYTEILDLGFRPEDFPEPGVAREQMEEHGLI